MRQAGRYLPEYRTVRGDGDILATIRSPEQVVELSLQPLRRMEVDAAILFSDIMTPLDAIGVPIRVESGVGPVLDDPIRDDRAIERLASLPVEEIPYVVEAIRLLRKDLTVPLIGFAGAPFTLACYLVEGGPSRTFERTKALMYGDAWTPLMEALVSIVVPYLRSQVEAGAQVLQIFDSWAGALDLDDYRTFVAPHTTRVFEALADLDVPAIHFGVATGELLGAMHEAGGDAVGVDWRTRLDVAWERAGGPGRVAIQGNLDPGALLGPWETVRRKALDVLAAAGGRDGHVFNLGHGVLPDTPVESLQRLVDLVHQETER
jgi:uroporphyrinogen decarboxylase